MSVSDLTLCWLPYEECLIVRLLIACPAAEPVWDMWFSREREREIKKGRERGSMTGERVWREREERRGFKGKG